MLLIPCPHCGSRAQLEFSYGGDATVSRPDPGAVDLSEWLDHIYLRDNPAGPHREWWYHGAGCGKWVALERDTVTHRFVTAGGGSSLP